MSTPRAQGLTLLLATVCLLSGCYQVRFIHSKLVPEVGAPREFQHQSLANGLWDLSGPVKLDEMCPSGAAIVENEETFVDGLVTEMSSLIFVAAPLATGSAQITAGSQLFIGRHLNPWTPSTVRVTCAKGAVVARKYAVLQLTPLSGVDPKLVDLITAGIVSELRRRPGVSVLAQSDITALLGMERQKAVLGCSDGSSCMAELADALGASRILHGTVGRVGSSLVVYLTLVDAQHARTVAQVSERLPSDEAFFDALPGIANQLMAETLVSGQ